MGTFNPAEFQARLAWQPIAGRIPQLSAFTTVAKHLRFLEGSSPTPTFEEILSESIDGEAQEGESLIGKISHQFDVLAEVNFEELVYLIAAAFGKGTQSASGGATTLTLGPSAHTGVVFGPLFALEVDRKDDLPVVFYDGRIRSLTFDVVAGVINRCTVAMGFAGHTLLTDSIVDTQTSGTEVMEFKGLFDYDTRIDPIVADRSVKFSVINAAAPFTIAGAVGADAFGAIVTTVVEDKFVVLLNSTSGLPIMFPTGEPVKVFIPSGGTPTIGDEFHVDHGRASFSPVFTTSPFANEVHSELLLDNEDLEIDTFNLVVTVPYGESIGPGGRFPRNNFQQGVFTTVLALGRKYIDVDLQHRIQTGQAARFSTRMFSPTPFVSGPPAVRYELSLYMPRLKPAGQLPATSRTSYDEALTARGTKDASDPFGGGLTDSINIVVVNSIVDHTL